MRFGATQAKLGMLLVHVAGIAAGIWLGQWVFDAVT